VYQRAVKSARLLPVARHLTEWLQSFTMRSLGESSEHSKLIASLST
jgi:hypothetical protein